MLIGLRIISILFDLFLASVLFYRPISKSKHSKRDTFSPLLLLSFSCGSSVSIFRKSRFFSQQSPS